MQVVAGARNWLNLLLVAWVGTVGSIKGLMIAHVRLA
jgi:hypothetical protein